MGEGEGEGGTQNMLQDLQRLLGQMGMDDAAAPLASASTPEAQKAALLKLLSGFPGAGDGAMGMGMGVQGGQDEGQG